MSSPAGPSSGTNASAAIAGLLCCALFLVWFNYAVVRPIPFWQETGDYSWYALSQAFTFEAKASGEVASNLGFHIHPGVPFGLASWAALRLETAGLADSRDRIADALAHADDFWLWAKVLALALNFAGIYVLQRMFRGKPLRLLVAAGIYFSMIPAVYEKSLVQLTNESFSLVFTTLFYFLSYRLLTAEVKAPSAAFGPSSFRSKSGLLVVTLGALAAVGCSLKIYYLAPAFGLVAGLLASIGVGTLSRQAAARIALLFGAGFLAVGLTIVLGVISWPSFKGWIGWNWEMLSHTSRYGRGDQGLLRPEFVLDAIVDLSRSTHGVFPTILCSAIGIHLVAMWRQSADASWVRANFPFSLAVLAGISLNLLGLLKHYSPLSQHYALPLCASLPCLLLVGNGKALARRWLWPALLVVAVLIDLNLRSYASIHAASLEYANAALRDAAAIKKLPIAPGEKRVWAYFSPVDVAIIPMVSQYAGSSLVSQVIDRTMGPTDTVPFADPEAADWRYVLFPKTYFPTRESIPVNSRKQFDFVDTKFEVNASDTITELETFLVLARAR